MQLETETEDGQKRGIVLLLPQPSRALLSCLLLWSCWIQSKSYPMLALKTSAYPSSHHPTAGHLAQNTTCQALSWTLLPHQAVRLYCLKRADPKGLLRGNDHPFKDSELLYQPSFPVKPFPQSLVILTTGLISEKVSWTCRHLLGSSFGGCKDVMCMHPYPWNSAKWLDSWVLF